MVCSDIWAVLLDMFRRIKKDKSTTWRFQRPHKQANHLGRVAYFKRFLFFLHSPGPGPSEVQSKDLYQAYWKSYVCLLYSKRYDVKECAMRGFYWVNLQFKDHNSIDTSLYTYLWISICIPADGCILWQA